MLILYLTMPTYIIESTRFDRELSKKENKEEVVDFLKDYFVHPSTTPRIQTEVPGYVHAAYLVQNPEKTNMTKLKDLGKNSRRRIRDSEKNNTNYIYSDGSLVIPHDRRNLTSLSSTDKNQIRIRKQIQHRIEDAKKNISDFTYQTSDPEGTTNIHRASGQRRLKQLLSGGRGVPDDQDNNRSGAYFSTGGKSPSSNLHRYISKFDHPFDDPSILTGQIKNKYLSLSKTTQDAPTSEAYVKSGDLRHIEKPIIQPNHRPEELKLNKQDINIVDRKQLQQISSQIRRKKKFL